MTKVVKRLSKVFMVGTLCMAFQGPGCTVDQATLMGLLDTLQEFSDLDLDLSFEGQGPGGGHGDFNDDFDDFDDHDFDDDHDADHV